MYSAFDGFMGKELEAKIWMFFKCQVYSCVQKSVSQLDWRKNIFVIDQKPRKGEMQNFPIAAGRIGFINLSIWHILILAMLDWV